MNLCYVLRTRITQDIPRRNTSSCLHGACRIPRDYYQRHGHRVHRRRWLSAPGQAAAVVTKVGKAGRSWVKLLHGSDEEFNLRRPLASNKGGESAGTGLGETCAHSVLELEVLVIYPSGDARNPVACPERRRHSPGWRHASGDRERVVGVAENHAASVIKASH